MTTGEIRKRAEISLHRQLGMDITKDQAKLIPTYALRLADGSLSLKQATKDIRCHGEAERDEWERPALHVHGLEVCDDETCLEDI